MHIQIPHKSSMPVAISKVKNALEHGKSQMAQYATIGEERWEGNVLHFSAALQGKQISGTLEVTDRDFVIDAKLPLLWRMFEGRIESMIAEQVKSIG